MSAAVKYLTKKVAEAENEAAKAWHVRSAAERRTYECDRLAQDARRELEIAIEARIRKERGLDNVVADTYAEASEEKKCRP